MDLFSSANQANDLTLNLTNDLVFFDLETTGLNVLKDRILQIALVKVYANGGKSGRLSLHGTVYLMKLLGLG